MAFPNQIYIANDPYLKFSQEYTKEHYGLNLMEVSTKVAEAWNMLSNEEKRLYQIRNYDHEEPYPVENRSSRAKSCSSPAKTRLPRKPRNASKPSCPPKKTRTAAMPSCEPKRAAKSRCATKPSCAPKKMTQCAPKKRRCAPKKPRCTPTKSRCAPKKPRCAPKKKRCAPKRKNCPKPRCAPKRRPRRFAIKYQKPGPVTNNGYFSFLSEYQKKQCGHELVMKAARAWCRLTKAQKDRYRR